MASINHEDNERGLVFNIQKYSLHDGTGIRTLVFLKGCPLSCTWCSNPEGQSYSPELFYNTDKCIGMSECDACVSVCKSGAISAGSEGIAEVKRESCDNCGECAEACPSKALEVSGVYMSVHDVIKVVEEDSSFYARSGGGLTLSGGEPLAQAGFLEKLLKAARGRGIDTAIETTGLCKWKNIEEIAPLTDQIFYDIKCLDPEKHKRTTGVSNETILENFIKLCKKFPETKTTVRTPIIPGINDTEEDIESIADFIRQTSAAVNYELLPYHKFGESKYGKLAKRYEMKDIPPPDEERMNALRKIVGSR